MNGPTLRRCRLFTTAAVLASALVAMSATLVPAADKSETETTAKKKKKKDKKATGKLTVGEGFGQAILATQLALQGEQRKSPILLLAAAEIVRGLSASDKSIDKVKFESKAGEGATVNLSVAALVNKAKELAREDKDLAALVEKRGEQLSLRGLDPSVGGSLPSVQLKDKTYKVLGGGPVPSNGTATIRNVPFVGGRVALVAAVGDKSMATLFVEVRDSAGNLIKSPPDVPAPYLTVWVPSQNESYTVKVTNFGPEQKVAFLANWD